MGGVAAVFPYFQATKSFYANYCATPCMLARYTSLISNVLRAS